MPNDTDVEITIPRRAAASLLDILVDDLREYGHGDADPDDPESTYGFEVLIVRALKVAGVWSEHAERWTHDVLVAREAEREREALW